MHPDCAPHPFAALRPPGDGLPTEEFTPEQVAALHRQYAELRAGVGELPTADEVERRARALGLECDPFRGQ
jgi:hypothetical protein